MQCIERTYEYLDGLILVELLKANGLDAYLFDENLVRLDWSAVLAYGGFRITVPNQHAETARELADAYRQGQLMIVEDECALFECPRCSSLLTEWNPRPRDWVRFGFFMLLPFGLIPLLLGYDFTHRFRCQSCHHRWRERPVATFADLQAKAEAASSPSIL